MRRPPSPPASLFVVLLAGAGSSPAWAASPEAPQQHLTLDEALARFHEDSPTADQLDTLEAEARATVRLAAAAALPVLAAQGGYTRNNAEAQVSIRDTFEKLAASLPIPVDLDTSSLPGTLIIQPLEVWSAGASLTVPLVAASAWADVAAARQGVVAAGAQREAALAGADAALIRAAWLSGAARERVEATRHAVDTATSHRDGTQRRLEQGVATPLEVLVASTELSRRASEHVQAEADLARTERALGALLGSGGRVAIDLPEPDTRPAPATDDAVQRALAFRPELTAAQASWRAATRQATSAWLRHLPTIAATGSLAAQTVAFPTGQLTAWRVGVQATWVFYDGGARYGLLRLARARATRAAASEDQLRLDAAREAADAVDGVDVALARARLAEEALATADEAEAAAARGYAEGVLTSQDVLDAQQRRLDAAVGRALASAQVGIARAELARATAEHP